MDNPLLAADPTTGNPLSAATAPGGGVTLADAWDYNMPAIKQWAANTWNAASSPQFWTDAARQYGNALIMGTTAPGTPGMAAHAGVMSKLLGGPPLSLGAPMDLRRGC